jgi:hypothetical protein
MEKQIIEEKVDYYINWLGKHSLSKLEEDLNLLKQFGCTHIDFKVDRNWADDELELSVIPIKQRLETDLEYKRRLDRENDHTSRMEKLERAQLAFLKAKYEPKQ